MMLSTRKLGDGPEITEIGLGTWAIGGPWRFGWGPQDSSESEKTIQQALDCGINWIDTAPAYGLGHAEEILGRVLEGKRDKIIISTKCGISWKSEKKISFDISPQSIRNECENSLKRLKTDYIDIYQIHWPDSKTRVEESWQEMDRLKKDGKVKYIGVSNFDLKLLKRCEKIAHVTSLQPPYSMVKRGIETDIMPWCKKNNTGIIAYSPMQAGLLTGKFSRDYLQTLAGGDWRKHDSFFKEPMFSRVMDFIEQIKPFCQKYKKSLAAFAVAWVLNHDGISAAIVGARNQIQAGVLNAGSGWKISDSDMSAVNEIYDKILS